MPAKSRYSHRLLLKTLHRLANSYVYSKSDYLYIYVSRLLCRWLFASLCKVFNRQSLRVPTFSRYIRTHIYIPAKNDMCTYMPVENLT